MIVASRCSTLPIFRGAGLGISISSLASPGLISFCDLPSKASRYLTRLGFDDRLDVPPKISSSREARSLICKGSSSASCSARSPVSLQESESEEVDREREERRPCFSECAPSRCSDWVESLPAVVERVRRGIFAGRRDGVWEGILKGAELFAAAPLRRVGLRSTLTLGGRCDWCPKTGEFDVCSSYRRAASLNLGFKNFSLHAGKVGHSKALDGGMMGYRDGVWREDGWIAVMRICTIDVVHEVSC